MRRACVAVAAVMVFGLGTVASAAPLGLLSGPPDLTGSTLFSYDSATHFFSASGSISGLDDGTSIFGVSGGTYSLQATIIDPINQLASGVLEISGGVAGKGIGGGTRLIRGGITGFGYDDSVPGFGGFEFKFDVTDGALSPLFGKHGGTILGPTDISQPSWNFATSFSSVSAATSDTVSAPEPALLLLMLTGGGGLLARRRVRRPSVPV